MVVEDNDYEGNGDESEEQRSEGWERRQIYDLYSKRGTFPVVDYKEEEVKATQFYDLLSGEVSTRYEGDSVRVGGVRVVTKDSSDGGLVLVMAQRRFFPRMKRVKNDRTGMVEEVEVVYPFYNPITQRIEDRRVQDYIADLSLSKDVYSAYNRYASSPTLDMREKVILLLGIITQSYPPTAIGEVVGMTPYTASRIVSTLAGEGLLGELRAEAMASGRTEAYRGEVYRQGPLLESYKVLTVKGKEYFRRLLKGLSAQSLLRNGNGEPPYKGEIAARVAELPRAILMPEKGGVIITSEKEKIRGPLESFLDIKDGELKVGKGGKRILFAGPSVENPLTREEAEYYILEKGLSIFGDVRGSVERQKLLDEYKRRFPPSSKEYHWIWRTAGGAPITYIGPPIQAQRTELALPGKPRIDLKVTWSREEAKTVGDNLGLGGEGYKSMVWKGLVKPPMGGGKLTDSFRLRQIGVDLEEFRMGLEAESEHADVTGGNAITTALIALAHLRERPDYYTRLRKMEAE